MAALLRYLEDSFDVHCPHCDEWFEDETELLDQLGGVELDEEGYARKWDARLNPTTNCPNCAKIIVYGCGIEPEFRAYYVRGRSEADIRLLERMGK